MAAAAGAPGSGEGGEAEPDSEPISGDGRPDEAAIQLGRFPEDLGWEGPAPLDGSAAEHREPGLPENEEVPEYAGPEVTSWERGAEAPGADTGDLEGAPGQTAEAAEPSEEDTGDNGAGGHVFSSQEEEEPMQLGEDFICPLVPRHGGLEMEGSDECERTSSEPEPVMLESTSSPQPQVMTQQLQCAPGPAHQAVQEMEAPAHQAVQEMEAPARQAVQEMEAPARQAVQEMEAPAHQAVQEMEAPAHQAVQEMEAPAHQAVQEMEAPAHQAVQEMEAPAHQAVQEMEAPAHQAVQELEAPAHQAVQEMEAPARQAVQEMEAPARQAVQELEAPARQAVQEMEAPARQAVQEMEAPDLEMQPPGHEEVQVMQALVQEMEAPAPEDVQEMEAPAPEEYQEMEAPAPEEYQEMEAPAPEEYQEMEAPAPEEYQEMEAPAPEEYQEMEAPAPEEYQEMEAPTPEEYQEMEAPTPEEYQEMEAPAPEEYQEMEAPAPEEYQEMEAPAPEEYQEMEALAPEEYQEMEAPAPEEYQEMEAPAPEEVQEMEAPDPEEFQEMEPPDPEEFQEMEAPAPEEAQEMEAPAPEEVQELEAPAPEEVQELEVPAPEEVQELEAPAPEEVQELEAPAPEEGDHLQESVPEKCELHEPELEVLYKQETAPMEVLHVQDFAPVELVHTQELTTGVVSQVQDSSLVEVYTQGPISDVVSQVETVAEEMPQIREPFLDVFQVPETIFKAVQEPVPEVVPLMEDSQCEVQEPVPEVMVQEPVPEVMVQEPVPEVMVQEPVPEVMVQEPVPEVMVQEPVPEVMVQEPVPEVMVQEPVPEVMVQVPVPEVIVHLQDKVPVDHTLAEETVPGSIVLMSDLVPEITEAEARAKTLETVVNSIHDLCKESFDPLDVDNEHVPKPFHKKIQHGLDTVSTEEQVLTLGIAEINQGAHPVSEQCSELGVEVKLFLQPVLKKLDEGAQNEDFSNGFHFVSHKTEFQAEPSPGETSVQLISETKYDSVPRDSRSPIELALEDAGTPVDKVISLELTSLGKELDSQSIHMETEPMIGNTSECTEMVSLSPDDEYDPFYRDTKKEQIFIDKTDASSNSVSKDNVLEQLEAPMVTPNNAQLKDANELCLEAPKPPSINPSIDACLDNPNQCQGPLPSMEQLLTSGIDGLLPGSEVQVTLDHIIQDALVVSFRHGDRIFSGVLMDLSKRFGPYGIPVTVHPKREYKNKPEEPIQLQSTSFQEDTSLANENGTVPMDVPPIQPTEPCGVQNLWTAKPPPLFHEGAPYPPPLFIRDTYNQSIPQPPPRKIKRLKKKIYREEPTSIMNAIKLRPRQVLCDKCKNVVADKKEARKTGNDSFKLEEGKRRRHESVTTVNKKLKTDHKVNGKSQSESQKRNTVLKVTSLGHGRGKVASQTHAPKTHLHTKKVLQSKNMDHAKAREVLKMAKEKAQKKQKDASSSKNAHGKVHLTRRLQNTSSGTLPPRLRIKPQRYRNEENDSSLKIGLESLRSSKMGIKPQTRYTATRSAGEAPSEIKTPPNGPEEVSSDIQNPSVCVPPGEQDEQDEQQALSKQDSKSNITVYMTLNQKKADSSSASVCSSDSTDDLKSTHSECSSTENFDFPPGSMHAPSSSSSSSSKEEKKLSNSLKIKMFSKNVSKCMTTDGRTICVGDIVWAKIYGFPWWPARILTITVSRKDNGLLIRQEARISWFGSPTTSFLALSQLSPFLENFQSRFNKKRKGLYRKAITEAAKAAKQLTPEVRALLTQFET